MAARGNDYFAKSLSILRNRAWGFSVRNEHEQEETERTEGTSSPRFQNPLFAPVEKKSFTMAGGGRHDDEE